MSTQKIRNVRVILTEPDGTRLTIVKVETTEPDLYGVGCATFLSRPIAVKAAVEDYLRPFLIGRSVGDIEDIWQSTYVSSYWRNSGVLNNAISGVDEALWDIKGKISGVPVFDQEYSFFGERTMEVFPGCPEVRDGYMWPNGKPGLGIDIDEELAARFPFRERAFGGAWDTVRRADGTAIRP